MSRIARLARKSFPADGLTFATALIKTICDLAGERTLIEDAQADFLFSGMRDAIQRHDSSFLYEWMFKAANYQGVSDAVAETYLEEHGSVSATDVGAALRGKPPCPKLQSYWHFKNCGYRKSSRSCSEPRHVGHCPLPTHDCRTGSLNQSAYSLALFMRDIVGNDFVKWLDERVEQADQPNATDRAQRMAQAVIAPLRSVHGISDKLLNMSLATLLLAGDPERERWVTAGASMIAVDSLVHNFMTRSGILRRLRSTHTYGPQCYGPRGCAVVIDVVARRIDARKLNPDWPRTFQRLVQKSIWRFCALSELNICNGNRIDDTRRCKQTTCELYSRCDRLALSPRKA